jgi:hypothetical protein
MVAMQRVAEMDISDDPSGDENAGQPPPEVNGKKREHSEILTSQPMTVSVAMFSGRALDSG